MSTNDNDFDANDLTIVDMGGALPVREIAGDSTREHQTDEPIMAAASGARELPVNTEWERGYYVGVAARRLDLRRALICELLDRGASALAAEELWQAVLRRSTEDDDDGRTA